MTIIGRLTKDAVVTQLKDERKVVNFTIALNDYYKPKNNDTGVTQTTFLSCAYWINPKIATLLKKGCLVELTGMLSVRAYTDMQGEAKGSIYCHVNAIKIHQHMKREAEISESKTEELPF